MSYDYGVRVCVCVCVYACVCVRARAHCGLDSYLALVLIGFNQNQIRYRCYKEKICGCTSSAFADLRASLATGVYMVHGRRACVCVCVCAHACVCVFVCLYITCAHVVPQFKALCVVRLQC